MKKKAIKAEHGNKLIEKVIYPNQTKTNFVSQQ